MKIKWTFQIVAVIALLLMSIAIVGILDTQKEIMKALTRQQSEIRYMSMTQIEFSDIFIKLFEQDDALMRIINVENKP